MARNGLGRVVRGLVGAGAIALVMVGQAAAVPLTGPLGFDQKAGFFSPATKVKAGLGLAFSDPLGLGYPTGTYKTLTWERPGEAGDPSKLQVTTYTSFNSPSAGTVALGDTNGNGLWDSSEFWTITRLVHTNNVIEVFGVPLWSLIAKANLTLFADAGLSIPIGTDSFDTHVTFNETENKATLAACPPPNPRKTRCDDFYSVAKAELVTPVTIDLGDGDFLDLTFKLFAPIPSNVTVLDDGTTVFVFTSESAPGVSVFDVQMHWATRHIDRVPAPAALVMVGLGLGAMAAFGRRRKTD